MALITALRSAAHKRAQYNATIRAIRSLPTDLAIEDLGIFPGDAERIAHETVYGR